MKIIEKSKELIPIVKSKSGDKYVNARALHDFVVKRARGGQKGEQFNHWIKRMIEHGFVLGEDYQTVGYDFYGNIVEKNMVAKYSQADNQGVRVNKREYYLTIEAAKEIAMIQNNDKGKEARKYFIACEKIAKETVQKYYVPRTLPEALRLAAQSIEENEKLKSENKKLLPKANFADAVNTSESSILVGDLARLLRQNGVDIGQNRLFKYMRDNNYLISRPGESRNMPTQYSMDRGWFEIKERVIGDPCDGGKITKTPKVTGKGQVYFINKFLNSKEVEAA